MSKKWLTKGMAVGVDANGNVIPLQPGMKPIGMVTNSNPLHPVALQFSTRGDMQIHLMMDLVVLLAKYGVNVNDPNWDVDSYNIIKEIYNLLQ